MIVVQSPLRVSLFGGGTDFPSFFRQEGGCVLSSSIDKRIFVTAKRRFDRKLRIGYTRTEMVEALDQIQHELIREALRMTGLREGVEISTMGDIPSAGSGLGSSSTVTVGTLMALYALLEEKTTPERLAQKACEIEIDILGKPIGVQDQYIAAYGGLRFIEFGTDGHISVEPVRADPDVVRTLDENLLLFYTGIARRAESVLAEQKANIGSHLEVLRQMKDLARDAYRQLEQGELDAIGELLHRSWMLKRQLAARISNGRIEEIYDSARRAGALGGKITGAGGGGFVLLYCPIDKQPAVREALAELQELPFRFASDGARVILDHRAQEQAERARQFSRRESEIRPAPSRANGSAPIIRYLHELQGGLDGLAIEDIEKIVDLLHRARLERRKVFIMGNGGSASTASHFACDLGKNTRLQGLPDFGVLALTDNLATFSALANDDGYENVFVGQLANLMESGDVVIGISTSGNSPNVVRAIEFAGVGGAHTIGLTGASGGRLGRIVDLSVKVPNHAIEQVEDIHLMLEHLICTALNDRALREGPRFARHDRELATAEGSPVAEKRAQGTSLDREGIRVLYEFNRALSAGNGSGQSAPQLLSLMVDKLGAESGSVILLNERGGVAGGSIAYSGKIQDRDPKLLAEVFEQGLAGWAARRQEAALVSNTKQDRRWLCKPWEANGWATRSAMTAPVMSDGHVMGMVTVARAQGSGYTERDLTLLRALALCVSLISQAD